MPKGKGGGGGGQSKGGAQGKGSGKAKDAPAEGAKGGKKSGGGTAVKVYWSLQCYHVMKTVIYKLGWHWLEPILNTSTAWSFITHEINL